MLIDKKVSFLSSFLFVALMILLFSQEALAETPKLILDHLFVYKNQMVNYRISVQGEIPLKLEGKGLVRAWDKGGKETTLPAIALTGTGKVSIRGRGNINPGGGFIVHKINYDSSMTITINGKTRVIKAPEEIGSYMFVNLELQENWDGSFSWDIETSDPKNDSLRLEMFKRIIPKQIPYSPHTGHTIEYSYLFAGNSTYEYVGSDAMGGTYRWRYIFSPFTSKVYEETINPDNQLRFDDDLPKPKDFIKISEGKLGPPLDQIQWELVDLDDIP